MQWRLGEIQRAGDTTAFHRWTILPPQFFMLLKNGLDDANVYGDGSSLAYPPLWDVDTVKDLLK
jgi:hypothetical protein